VEEKIELLLEKNIEKRGGRPERASAPSIYRISRGIPSYYGPLYGFAAIWGKSL
jgi:hypothetical protein